MGGRGRRYPTGTECWIDVTADMAALLRAEFVRTGYEARNFLDGAVDLPERLNARIVQGWLYSEAKTTDAMLWEYVVARLAAMPDRDGPPPLNPPRKPRKIATNTPDHAPIRISDLALLRAHRERTKVGGAVLLRGAIDKPDGLTPAMISLWLSGKTLTAKPEHIEYVLAGYATLPSRA